MRRADADCLIIGAGTTGLAFADTLITESDAHVTLVELGSGVKDPVGPEPWHGRAVEHFAQHGVIRSGTLCGGRRFEGTNENFFGLGVMASYGQRQTTAVRPSPVVAALRTCTYPNTGSCPTPSVGSESRMTE